jgi:hypothetical protein
MGSFPNDPKSTGADEAPPAELSKTQSDLYEVLHHFSDALAIVETVANPLESAQRNLKCSTIGAEIATLRQAVDVLAGIHEEFDLAILEVES